MGTAAAAKHIERFDAINLVHRDVQDYAKNMVERAYECGHMLWALRRDLAELKKQKQIDRPWQWFIASYFEGSRSTAWMYMKLNQHINALPPAQRQHALALPYGINSIIRKTRKPRIEGAKWDHHRCQACSWHWWIEVEGTWLCDRCGHDRSEPCDVMEGHRNYQTGKDTFDMSLQGLVAYHEAQKATLNNWMKDARYISEQIGGEYINDTLQRLIHDCKQLRSVIDNMCPAAVRGGKIVTRFELRQEKRYPARSR